MSAPKYGDLVIFDYEKNEREWNEGDEDAPQLWTDEIRASDNHTGTVIDANPDGLWVRRITEPLIGQAWTAPAADVLPWDGPEATL